jgi:short-subunit dehydrogenase
MTTFEDPFRCFGLPGLLKEQRNHTSPEGRDSRPHGVITGSIAGFMPGSFQAAYNARKAFLDSFSEALRNELKVTGITVTCLMPGATETEFFERADLMDTKIGQAEGRCSS